MSTADYCEKLIALEKAENERQAFFKLAIDQFADDPDIGVAIAHNGTPQLYMKKVLLTSLMEDQQVSGKVEIKNFDDRHYFTNALLNFDVK